MLYPVDHLFADLPDRLQVGLEDLDVLCPHRDVGKRPHAGVKAEVAGHHIGDALGHHLGVPGAPDVGERVSYLVQQRFRSLILGDVGPDPDQSLSRRPVTHGIGMVGQLRVRADGYALFGYEQQGFLAQPARLVPADHRDVYLRQFLPVGLADVENVDHFEVHRGRLRRDVFIIIFLFLFPLGRKARRQDHNAALSLFDLAAELPPGRVAGDTAGLGHLGGDQDDIAERVTMEPGHRIDEVPEVGALVYL